jgi:hybrid polyketide synthase/nonribosomal peptide synthetase ACE1
MQNLRRLIKPGGFLVVLEFHAMDNIARAGAIFGAFPGWWLGADDGRVLSPCINLPEWDALLRGAGFSGCDTVSPVKNVAAMPVFVFVSQAVDERVEFLRDPLSSHIALFERDEQRTLKEDLVLLGGNSLQTSRLIGQLRTILRQQWGHNIRNARSLAELSSLSLSSSTTVLSVTEMDAPVFKNLDDHRWEALKSMLHGAGTILWVSKGRRAEEPYANMMVGLLRGSKMELPTLDIQLFDAEGERPAEARTIATALLQLVATTLYHRRDGQDSLLATVEPEIVRERSGQLVIPRVVPSQERNDRYNSLRRPILKSLGDEIEQNVGISSSSSISLQQVPAPEASGKANRRIHLTHSLRSTVHVADSGCLHLVLGRDCNSGSQVVALLNEHSLLACATDELSIPVQVPAGSEAEFIYRLACCLLANVALEGLAEGDEMLVHEPDSIFATVLEEQSKRCGVNVKFTTISIPPANHGWVRIHARAPNRTIRALGVTNTAVFLDFSRDKTPGAIGHRICGHLPANCQRQTLETIFATSTSWTPRDSQLHGIQVRLETCIASALSQLNDPNPINIPTVSLSVLATSIEESSLHNVAPQTVIIWPSSTTGLPVPVRPIDSQIRFSNSKTYWLAGLSGGLGLLLCEWMVRHGAKYIVISSRAPKIAEPWLEKMRTTGAVTRVLAWLVDFFNFSSSFTFPPSSFFGFCAPPNRVGESLLAWLTPCTVMLPIEMMCLLRTK